MQFIKCEAYVGLSNCDVNQIQVRIERGKIELSPYTTEKVHRCRMVQHRHLGQKRHLGQTRHWCTTVAWCNDVAAPSKMADKEPVSDRSTRGGRKSAKYRVWGTASGKFSD